MRTSLLTQVEAAPHALARAARTRDLGALLFAAADRCVRTKLRAVNAGGFSAITEAQLTLFHHLEPSGSRLTALAERANLTKQSMIELVDRAAAMGLIDRRPDPQDGRAKMVHQTVAATELLTALRDGVANAETEVCESFGAAFLTEARRKLATYTAPANRSFADLPLEAAWRVNNMGRLFALAARRLMGEALALAHDRGPARITEVSLSLFRNLAPDGSRLTDIATRARITKQSMRELVDRAAALGLVERRPDPADGRAKIILLTARGRDSVDDVWQGVVIAEQRFTASNGERFMVALKDRLTSYARPVSPPPAG